MSRLIRWLLVIAWAVIIFGFSSEPSLTAVKISWLDFFIKKAAHISEYMILYLLVWLALVGKGRTKKAFLLCLFYAFTDETHQLLIPGRTGTIRDVLLFDMPGLILGSVLVSLWERRYAK